MHDKRERYEALEKGRERYSSRSQVIRGIFSVTPQLIYIYAAAASSSAGTNHAGKNRFHGTQPSLVSHIDMVRPFGYSQSRCHQP